jgi:cytochrome P450
VRVGPNELSFANPDAVKDIHGANSGKLPKGPSYGTGLWADGKGMSQSPLPEHKLRRKSWEKGLSSKAIAEYESRILKIIDVFVAKIAQFEGKLSLRLRSTSISSLLLTESFSVRANREYRSLDRLFCLRYNGRPSI